MFLQDFRVVRPKFEANQEMILNWIANAHAQTRKQINEWNDSDNEYHDFTKELKENLLKIGLGEKKIQKRGFQINDCYHDIWEEMKIYNINSSPEGYQLDKRMEFFNESAFEVFENFYPIDASLPSHLIHVTCTGYVAPSPAQRIVSSREGGKNTIVTHAYHMGCYGAIPSIRIGMGHLSVEKSFSDIVHTEFCSLHLNPTLHSIEQLIVQSLFADGFIKYSITDGKKASSKLKILSILEEVLENTTKKMTWNCNPWGFQMTISKDIPVLLRRNIEGYLKRLAEKAGKKGFEGARFAIHPGGPKIIEQIAEILKLEPEQIRHSQEVLQNFGNMSSATLPHVWDRILQDPMVQDGESVVSIAFGPGLSISGGFFEKQG